MLLWDMGSKQQAARNVESKKFSVCSSLLSVQPTFVSMTRMTDDSLQIAAFALAKNIGTTNHVVQSLDSSRNKTTSNEQAVFGWKDVIHKCHAKK